MERVLSITLAVILIISSTGMTFLAASTNGDESYDLLILTPSYFASELDQFVQHKEHYGVKTKLVTLSEIDQNVYFTVSGRDDAEKMKHFIKNALDEWNITYVLIVGGRKPGVREHWYAPVRYVTNTAWGVPNYTYLSDLYFADIYGENGTFQSWDTNGDDIFGTQRDTMDLHPDVFLGRWSCRTRMELRTVVKKTIAYESQQEKTKRIVLVGGDVFEDPSTNLDEGEVITNQSGAYLQGYEKVKVFSSEKSVSPKEIRAALGGGASFMHFSGHAWAMYWTVYKHDKVDSEAEPGLGIWNVPLFSNTQYPIVVMGGCHSSMFNIAFTYGSIWSPNLDLPEILKVIPPFECIGWSFNKKKGGGSVATLGYTNAPSGQLGEYGDLDYDGIKEPDCLEFGAGYMEGNFFYAFGVEGKTSLGACWAYTENTYINTFNPMLTEHLLTIQGFVILGDPSLYIGGYDLG